MIKKGDVVIFKDLQGLRKDVKDWIDKSNEHTVKKIHKIGVTVIELEPIEEEYPLLDDLPYVFFEERLEVVKK